MKWVKGQSGNPLGRPKNDIRWQIGVELAGVHKKDIQDVVERLFQSALKGEVWAIKAVCEYFIGKPRDTIPESSDAEEEARALVQNLPSHLRQEFHEYLKDLIVRAQQPSPSQH